MQYGWSPQDMFLFLFLGTDNTVQVGRNKTTQQLGILKVCLILHIILFIPIFLA